MRTFSFYKYQGTGNDFVILDNRKEIFDKENLTLVQQLCDRKFGIGADGLILIENHESYDFELIYFNSDGSKSFCGNGSRCGVAFAKYLGIIKQETTFLAIDGVHQAKIEEDVVHLKMNDVHAIEKIEDAYYLNTGSPHYNIYTHDLKGINILEHAHAIRYNARFKADGTNVNFVQKNQNGLTIRTYERGVENETLSCGTGATAVAISSHIKYGIEPPIHVTVMGGDLFIDFKKVGEQQFKDIWLIGKATFVFKGEITI